MNYSRLGLAALGGTVASFAFGFLVMWLAPALFEEGHKYPAVFRPKEQMQSVMPIALVATFIAILVVAIIFAVCNVAHNYVNLNIGLKLALGQAAAYFVQWTIVGIVIGLIYKPLATP